MSPTPPRPTAGLLLVLSLSLLITSAHQLTPPPAARPKQARTAGIAPALVSTLRETLDAVRDVASIISAFPAVGGILGAGDLRLTSAVADCLDLLDLSADELSWSMSAVSPAARPAAGGGAAGGRVGTGDARSDLRAWLSGALGNQDTCKDGLDETGSPLGPLVSAALQTLTSLLADGLGQVVTGEEGASSRHLRGRGLSQGAPLPRWLGRRERRLLQMPVGGAGGMAVDAVVARDGSGNYTTVQAALDAAPSEGAGRWVIYVKRGVYNETVEVKKKKWNVMMVGDGMGATVVSGRLNYVDGYSTFRTATVGECSILL
jgi:pectinesterase